MNLPARAAASGHGHRSVAPCWYTWRVLSELRVENLLLIERAELRLAPGLNVLTGETGAGKTVLAQALDLLLGGRARAGVVRPGAAEAYVEGVFELSPGLREQLGERLPENAEELVLARRVGSDGRSRAYLNGRTSTLGEIRELAEAELAFYGQHEHRRLTLAAAQLEALDGFCGEEHLARRGECAVAHRELLKLEEDLTALEEVAGAREREVDLLQFELAEIEEAQPDEDEHQSLCARRERLRALDALRAAVGAAAEALIGDDTDGPGAATLMARVESALDGCAGADEQMEALAVRSRAAALEAADLATDLARYAEALDEEPESLEAVEERLAVLERLMRKHGGSIRAVLDHAERCRARREELLGAEVAREHVSAAIRQARDRRARLVDALRTERVSAAPRLAAAVRERLAELAMPQVRFAVELAEREPGPSGADTAEFLIATNPGVPAGPVREIASGGELSRVMLALLGVAHADSRATLVFDEVDAGIGGQTARAVGAQLRGLADGRQVLCITHLPQIASLATRHFSVRKDLSCDPARTVVVTLDDREVVGELVRMLGADEDDGTARRHARELLKAA